MNLKVDISERKNVRYWTFMNNPARWQSDLFLASGGTEFQYLISNNWNQYYISPGQLGVIRVGVDRRNRTFLNGRQKLMAGVYAIVEVISFPYQRETIDPEFWLGDREHILGEASVRLRVVNNLLNNPILLNQLDVIEDDEHLIRGFEGRTMPLSPTTFEKILDLSGGMEETVTSNEFLSKVNDASKLKELDEKYANSAPVVQRILSKRIERGNVGEYVKRLSGNKCQVCVAMGKETMSFKVTGSNEINYIEAHHVHEVHKLNAGSLRSNNIIALCPLHHRQMHYGNVILKDETETQFIFEIDGKEVIVSRIHY
jgi:hypothetical protein